MATARTVRELIHSALRIAGVWASGETVSASDETTALDALEDMIAEWSGDEITIPSVTIEALTLVVSQASYAIGENGSPDLNTVRPSDITRAYVRSGDYDYYCSIIKEREYNLIVDKTLESRPEVIFYNPTSPNGTLYCYPVPDTADSMYLSSYKPLKEPASMTENMLNTTEIPREYHNALKWNLACDIAPEYELPITEYMYRKAEKTYSRIESSNAAKRATASRLDIDFAETRRNRNILTM